MQSICIQRCWFGGGFGLSKKQNSQIVEKQGDVQNIGSKTIDFDPTLFEVDTLVQRI